MPGTRTTQNVGPVLGSCYPVDVALVADEVNLWERNAKLIVYKRTQGQGKFEAVISDAEGNEHDVIVGATAAHRAIMRDQNRISREVAACIALFEPPSER